MSGSCEIKCLCLGGVVELIAIERINRGTNGEVMMPVGLLLPNRGGRWSGCDAYCLLGSYCRTEEAGGWVCGPGGNDDVERCGLRKIG
jgi:hypothetical protein